MTPTVPLGQIEDLAAVHTDFDRAFNRTRSRAAVDGGVLLLALIDELRLLRAAVEAQTKKGSR